MESDRCLGKRRTTTVQGCILQLQRIARFFFFLARFPSLHAFLTCKPQNILKYYFQNSYITFKTILTLFKTFLLYTLIVITCFNIGSCKLSKLTIIRLIISIRVCLKDKNILMVLWVTYKII